MLRVLDAGYNLLDVLFADAVTIVFYTMERINAAIVVATLKPFGAPSSSSISMYMPKANATGLPTDL